MCVDVLHLRESAAYLSTISHAPPLQALSIESGSRIALRDARDNEVLAIMTGISVGREQLECRRGSYGIAYRCLNFMQSRTFTDRTRCARRNSYTAPMTVRMYAILLR